MILHAVIGTSAALGSACRDGSRKICKTMTRVFRISKSPDVGDILGSVDAVAAFARDHGPGRYDVHEYSLDPFPGTKVPRGRGRGYP